jgi:magnesium-transporting ATPase (P-type)
VEQVKRSSAFVDLGHGQVRVLVKGAPEILIKFCSKYLASDGSVKALSAAKLADLTKAQDEMSNGQKRVICLAHKDVAMSSLPGSPTDLTEDQLNDLCTSDLVVDAYVGIIDPLRPDVPHSVAVAQAAGVKVRHHLRRRLLLSHSMSYISHRFEPSLVR